jgi:biopolymer transport protein ExbB/TolQ
MSSLGINGPLDASIYGAMFLLALYGAFCVILMLRRISQKRFSSESAATQFLEEVREQLGRQQYDAVAELCDSPPYWSKAAPQLILVAIANRERPMGKLRRLVAEKFERDVLADLEYRASWIASVVKTAPMLGLLGTVIGMIAAFAKIAATSKTGADPAALANDISFALFTTAVGLIIAIPLVLAGNMIHVRIGKMQDAVQQHLGIFFEDLEAAQNGGRPA